jgi:predicted secreted Zn-dependent protease
MREAAWGLLLIAGLCAGAAGEAYAGVKTTVQTTHYVIAGKTGAALLDAMDRRGPKHGLLTRAIAQTRYTIAWKMEWGETRAACRVKRADGTLAVIYTYPKVSGPVSRAMQRKWDRFLAGVTKHEKMHGLIARQMVDEAQRSIGKLAIRNDPGCRKSRREVTRRVDAVYAKYEKRQVGYDEREHREGGPVEALIDALVAER